MIAELAAVGAEVDEPERTLAETGADGRLGQPEHGDAGLGHRDDHCAVVNDETGFHST
jgi:hypothetical protein